MKTWDDIKKKQTSISPDEMATIDKFADLCVQRMKQGISQTELAKEMGITQSKLAKMETLDIFPSSSILTRYAAGLQSITHNQFN